MSSCHICYETSRSNRLALTHFAVVFHHSNWLSLQAKKEVSVLHSQPNRVWNNRAVRIELQRGANRRDVVGSVGKAEEATCKMRTSGPLLRLAWAMAQDRECNKLPSTPLKSGYELGLWRAITCCKEHALPDAVAPLVSQAPNRLPQRLLP